MFVVRVYFAVGVLFSFLLFLSWCVSVVFGVYVMACICCLFIDFIGLACVRCSIIFLFCFIGVDEIVLFVMCCAAVCCFIGLSCVYVLLLFCFRFVCL